MTTKAFAQQARQVLMDGVAKKLLYWGFSPQGEVIESPESVSGGYTFRGDAFDDANVPKLWRSLKTAVTKKGVEEVIEEAAYTWFNRLMALRIMAKNGYEPSLLQNAEGLEHTPLLLQKARQGQYDFLNPTEKERLKKIISDYTKDQEAFALLLVGYCHSNATLNTVFGKLDDYTELLLPDNMLQDSGFLHLLNTTDAISDEEYQQVELIGWLYQFYISERKDEVFASFKKRKKAEAKDIPAATQIFTPNWIVKYMVENTAGKIWLDKHPNSPIKNQMKYLVDNSDVIASDEERETKQSLISDITELTLLDPAVGSGHILVEGFDLLYQMYMEEYYTPEEAVESILKNNLYGLDLDDRAAQLANFAILLKSATKYRDVFTKEWLPNVYAMPESKDFSTQDLNDFLDEEGKDYLEELDDAIRLMKQAKNLGSIMKLTLSEDAYGYIQERYESLLKEDYLDLNLQGILQGLKVYIPILLILTKKYAAVVANPPYMGQGNMNADLKNYVNANYPLSKSDLFTVFMDVSINILKQNGFYGMINQHSWMFLSTYKKFRNELLIQWSIDSLIHLGPGTFEEISGEVVQSVAFIIQKYKNNKIANYYRYVNLKENKNQAFLKRQNSYLSIESSKFNQIPGNPIGYWLNDKLLPYFSKSSIDSLFQLSNCIQPGNPDKNILFWFEISYDKIQRKWFKLSKGGEFRRWYGNLINVINYENNAQELRAENSTILRGEDKYFNAGIVWTRVGAKVSSFRKVEKDILCTDASPILYDSEHSLLGFLNTKVAQDFLDLFNPTFNTQVGNVKNIPILNFSNYAFKDIENNNVILAKQDWDSRETSWDFKLSPLLNETTNLEEAYTSWQKDVTQDFFQLHANEEELNRIFIDIYGLQDELTPEVALKDITILQEELKTKDLEADELALRDQGLGISRKDKGLPLVPNNYSLPIDKAEVISQFISYAIGVFMGRYRLDKPGLHIAHPNPSADEIASYTYKGKTVEIDEDAIIPLMGTNSNFPDDALPRFNALLDVIWGGDTRTENINFIQECLDKDLERFLVRDFYKYHCKMYKKKPIYWLFASPKGAFQVLVYMHRMNAFTVEKIRANYLLPHLKHLQNEIGVLEGNKANLSTQEARKMDQLRKDLRECEEYDLVLKNTADQQITFDLDDGVKENYKLFEDVVAKIK